MNIPTPHKRCILILTCLVFALTAPAWARSLADITQAMKQRAPIIGELKAKGIVGENNAGYLAFVSGAREEESLVAAENTDRKAVYAYLAKKENTSLSNVEKRQAIRKAKNTESGEFYQTEDGAWKRKE